MKITKKQLTQIIKEELGEGHWSDDHERPFDEKLREFNEVIYDLATEVASHYKAKGADQENSHREIMDVLNSAVGLFEEGSADGMDIYNVLDTAYGVSSADPELANALQEKKE